MLRSQRPPPGVILPPLDRFLRKAGWGRCPELSGAAFVFAGSRTFRSLFSWRKEPAPSASGDGTSETVAPREPLFVTRPARSKAPRNTHGPAVESPPRNHGWTTTRESWSPASLQPRRSASHRRGNHRSPMDISKKRMSPLPSSRSGAAQSGARPINPELDHTANCRILREWHTDRLLPAWRRDCPRMSTNCSNGRRKFKAER
jgi:hypothetical protein